MRSLVDLHESCLHTHSLVEPLFTEALLAVMVLTLLAVLLMSLGCHECIWILQLPSTTSSGSLCDPGGTACNVDPAVNKHLLFRILEPLRAHDLNLGAWVGGGGAGFLLTAHLLLPKGFVVSFNMGAQTTRFRTGSSQASRVSRNAT